MDSALEAIKFDFFSVAISRRVHPLAPVQRINCMNTQYARLPPIADRLYSAGNVDGKPLKSCLSA